MFFKPTPDSKKNPEKLNKYTKNIFLLAVFVATLSTGYAETSANRNDIQLVPIAATDNLGECLDEY